MLNQIHLKSANAKGMAVDFPTAIAAGAKWLWARPFLLVLLGHALFSFGIWNARDGYAEEEAAFKKAFQCIQMGRPAASVYVNLMALALCWITPDPLQVATLLKYVSSLLATVALYFALSSFSRVLRPGAILFACFLWIASSLNAPFLQSTSLSLFTFAIMLIGIDCLLHRESPVGLFGFYLFGLLAASLRPEYYLAILLITIYLALRGLRRGPMRLESRLNIPRRLSRGLVLGCVMAIGASLWISPSEWIGKKAGYLNEYGLFAFGQCYADFYHQEHPEATFSPMTEYKTLFNQTFKHPKTFWAAIRNNPSEAVRYFVLNAKNNLGNIPPVLLRFRIHSAGGLGWYWRTLSILIAGAVLGAVRLYLAGWIGNGFLGRLAANLRAKDSVSRKVLLLLVLAATSSVAVFLLVGSPRYFLALAPLFYLGVACGVDSILKLFPSVRFECCLVAVAFLCYCSPNYLSPRPNLEMAALRHVAAYVQERPTVAAWWAEPDVLLGLRGNALGRSSFDGISEADFDNGLIDIFMIDENLRGTRIWADQRNFFEQFEFHPEKYGFKKLTSFPAGRFDVYYKPKQF